MKYLLSTAAVLTIAFMIYWLATNKEAAHNTTPIISQITHKNSAEGIQNSDINPAETSDTFTEHSADESDAGPLFTEQDYADIAEDRNSDFFANRDSHPYIHYDTAALKSLAADGDVVAMKELSARLTEEAMSISNEASGEDLSFSEMMKKNDEAIELFEEAHSYQKMAVYHGDRESLVEAKEAFTTGMKSDFETNLSPKEELFLNLAYDTFIGMRGNKLAMFKQIEKSLYIHEHVHDPIFLTPEDKRAIHKQASEIYEEIESQRIKLGLGPFDNTPRDYEIKQYDSFLEEHKETLGENVFIN